MITSPHYGRVPPSGTVRQPTGGTIIYDEVHLLPAPVFRMTADSSPKRRLGLTVREDGREGDVFSLPDQSAMTRRGRTLRRRAGSRQLSVGTGSR